MILDLPYSHHPIFSLKVHTPTAILDIDQISSMHTVDVPEDTFMVILDARDDGYRIKGSWGYDRVQWLAYKPEYHNKERLGPKVKEVIPVEPMSNPMAAALPEVTESLPTSERTKKASRKTPPAQVANS
jgi:hypothetical protein